MIVVVGISMSIVDDAYTDECKLTPSLAVKEEYNDNILYTSTNTEKDFISTISPALALTNKTERTDFSLSGRLDHRLYSSHRDLNDTDQYYEVSGKHAFTERLNLSGKLLYSKDSRPDRDFETTGLALANVERERQNYAVSGDYLLSEQLMATVSYDYLKDTYDSLFYTDLEASTYNLGFIRDLTGFMESTKARMNIGYAKYNMPGLKIDNYEATIGVERPFNEKWSLLFDGGGRYTRSQFKFTEYELVPVIPPFVYRINVVERTEKSDDWGTVGALTLSYKGPRDYVTISAVHDVLPASGRSGTARRTSFVFSMSRRFTYELYGTLSGGYYLNKSRQGEFSAQKIDESTMRISPGIRYQFDKDKMIEAVYTYNRSKYNVNNTKAERNLFMVRFRIQHDLFE